MLFRAHRLKQLGCVMPLPTPDKDESHEDFMTRCLSDDLPLRCDIQHPAHHQLREVTDDAITLNLRHLLADQDVPSLSRFSRD